MREQGETNVTLLRCQEKSVTKKKPGPESSRDLPAKGTPNRALHDLIEKAGVTQQQVAEVARVSRAQISYAEYGAREIGEPIWIVLAQIFQNTFGHDWLRDYLYGAPRLDPDSEKVRQEVIGFIGQYEHLPPTEREKMRAAISTAYSQHLGKPANRKGRTAIASIKLRKVALVDVPATQDGAGDDEAELITIFRSQSIEKRKQILQLLREATDATDYMAEAAKTKRDEA